MCNLSSKEIITHAQCQQVVNAKFEHDDVKLLEYSFEPYSVTKDGFMGEHLKLTCKVELDGKKEEIKLFAKVKQTASPDPIAELFGTIDVYAKESMVYDLIWKTNPTGLKWCSKMYGYFNEKCIILEDLRDLGYGLSTSTLFNFDLAHCKAALDSLAGYHAFSINLARTYTKDVIKMRSTLQEMHSKLLSGGHIMEVRGEIGKKFNEVNKNSSIYLMDMLVENPKMDLTERRQLMEYYWDQNNMQLLHRPSEKYLNVINHGDVWGNNILYKYDGNNQVLGSCLIDFQAVHYGPPVIDILKFIFINTTLDLQKVHLDHLLDYYYEKLTDHVEGNLLEKVFSKDDFHAACNEYMIECKIMAFQYKQCLMMQNFAQLLVNREYLYGNRILFLEDELNRKDCGEYKRVMRTLVVDLEEAFIKYGKLQLINARI